MRLGIGELLILLLIAVLLFGGKKLSGVGKALGQSIREFKEELKPEDKASEGEDKNKEA